MAKSWAEQGLGVLGRAEWADLEFHASVNLSYISHFHAGFPDYVHRIRPGLCPELPFHIWSTQKEIFCVRCILTYWKCSI